MSKKRLIEKLHEQLVKAKPNSEISMGKFSDDSASWIEIKPETIDLKKGYCIVEVLFFNGKGTVLQDVRCYKETFSFSTDSEKIF